jgi:hypothetical protein
VGVGIYILLLILPWKKLESIAMYKVNIKSSSCIDSIFADSINNLLYIKFKSGSNQCDGTGENFQNIIDEFEMNPSPGRTLNNLLKYYKLSKNGN